MSRRANVIRLTNVRARIKASPVPKDVVLAWSKEVVESLFINANGLHNFLGGAVAGLRYVRGPIGIRKLIANCGSRT